MIEDICSSFLDVISTEGQSKSKWVKPYNKPVDTSINQFVLFLKPEATALHEGVNINAVLQLITKCLQGHQVEIGAVRVLNGNYLNESGIMAAHYGVINSISTKGIDAISDAAKEKLQELYGEDIKAGAAVLGGHQFLEKFPDFNAASLCTINDNIGTAKLAGGTYALKLEVLGEPVIILNPFHPYQLVPFTTPGRGIIVMEALSNTDWAELRQNLAGATNPIDAAEGSIRQQLLENQAAIGMKTVNQGNNGLHLSAGPLEGMVELQRFLNDTAVPISFEDTAFGSLLAENGKDVNALAENPDISVDGQNVSAFDLTEEINAADAVSKL